MFGDNVKKRRIQLGMTQDDLARAVGKKQQNINQLELGVVSQPRYMRDLLKALKCEYGELINGQFRAAGIREDGSEYEIDPRSMGKVPLISSVQAGSAQLAIDLLAPGDADEWLFCNTRHSENTYALRVDGDSMTRPYGTSYPEKCIVFVDPEKRGDVTTGDPIIAKINGVDAATFKCFARDGERVFLKPLNPQYPPIMEEFRILGKVIEKLERPE